MRQASTGTTMLRTVESESIRFCACSSLHAAATIGVEPAACAVVEDTPSGVQAAVAAGMRAFGYTADSDERALREAGAERLGSLDELPRLLGLEAEPTATSPAKLVPTEHGTGQ